MVLDSMKKVFYYLFHEPRSLMIDLLKIVGAGFPDAFYLKLMFRLLTGKKLNLRNPRSFSEKMQWLKLYDHNPDYTKMVDKYAVKDYVAGIIGDDYIIPTLGVWNSVEDIDWDNLPNQFVLKCTHDSGGLVICRDKNLLDKEAAKAKLSNCLQNNYYKKWREWPYKNVPRRIIAEKYIEPAINTDDLPDYKFFCFNGEPRYCQLITGRNTTMCIDFFDQHWNHQPFHEPKCFPFSEDIISKPSKYELMWELARKLAENKAFSRIDFYQVIDKVYFGEITFYPTTGMGGFEPDEYDNKFGDMIQLPNKR